jgi:hypothetical protein
MRKHNTNNIHIRQSSSKSTENKIFGVQLEMVLNRQKALYPKLQVPVFIEGAVQYIMKYGMKVVVVCSIVNFAKGLKERDIFKALVPYTKVKETKAKVDSGILLQTINY